jgi:hypothetical protein
MTVAGADRRRPQLPGRVRGKKKRTSQKTRNQRHSHESSSVPEGRVAGRGRHEEILPGIPGKTDSAGSLKILLPGSWN